MQNCNFSDKFVSETGLKILIVSARMDACHRFIFSGLSPRGINRVKQVPCLLLRATPQGTCLTRLNAYVGYYKKNEMAEGDNPPVGVLLYTDKGSEMVEYALSGMDNQLFVSTYMLHLPDKKKLQEFILKEMEDMGI